MHLQIDLPKDIAEQLAERWGDVAHHTLEALAVKAYREGILSTAEVQRLLSLPSRFETEEFLKGMGASFDYTEANLEQDLAAIRKTSRE